MVIGGEVRIRSGSDQIASWLEIDTKCPRSYVLVRREDSQRDLQDGGTDVVPMARLVTPTMERQGKGSIVNITTFTALEPMLALPVSCTLRAGLCSFTKLYADRYAAARIRMNSILPGYIDSLNHTDATADSVPMKRIGTVDEIVRTTWFLLSDGAGYITGQSIRVDGGFTRHV